MEVDAILAVLSMLPLGKPSTFNDNSSKEVYSFILLKLRFLPPVVTTHMVFPNILKVATNFFMIWLQRRSTFAVDLRPITRHV